MNFLCLGKNIQYVVVVVVVAVVVVVIAAAAAVVVVRGYSTYLRKILDQCMFLGNSPPTPPQT